MTQAKQQRVVLAMDLGTSNTCLVLCDAAGKLEQISPDPCCNNSSSGTIPTLVLYKGELALAIGAQAEDEYGEASLNEKAEYRLSALFKPDVVARPQARQAMLDFLTLLRRYTPMPQTLLVGVPSEAGNQYRETVRQCLHQAGWAEAHFLSEPLGAVIHYIVKGALSPSQAARGVLTVDFGGGTCDFAVLRRAAVSERSGDMLFGGRLFDDLFWQMLLECNAGLEEEIAAEGNSYYVHWLACRQAKEEFSRAMGRERSRPVTVRVRWSRWDGRKAVERAAYIEGLTWQDFLLRAGNYVASDALLDLLGSHAQTSSLSPAGAALLAGRRVDLIDWFEQLLRQSLRDCPEGVLPSVLLTGGSSGWPFVADLVRQCCGNEVLVLTGDEPYADIAKGLAQFYNFSERLNKGRQALQEELPLFLERRLARALRRGLDSAVTGAMYDCAAFLRDAVIVPQCVLYKKQGGSLRDLMVRTAHAMEAQQEVLSQVMGEAVQRLGADMARICAEELTAWFAEKAVPIVPERLQKTALIQMDELLHAMRVALEEATLAPLRDKAAWAAAGAVGAAGLAAGAVGIVAAGVFALPLLVAAGLGSAAVKYLPMGQKVTNAMMEWQLPALVRSSLLTESRVAALGEQQAQAFQRILSDKLLLIWANGERRMLQETERVAREEIAALDILHVTPA